MPVRSQDIDLLRVYHNQKKFDDEVDRIILSFNDHVLEEKVPIIPIMLPGRDEQIMSAVARRMVQADTQYFWSFMKERKDIESIPFGAEDHYNGPNHLDGRTYVIFKRYG